MSSNPGNRAPAEDDWRMGFVMPNVSIRECFEFGDIAIVGGSDERLHQIRQRNQAAVALLSGFRHCLGPEGIPTSLIYRNPNGLENLWDAMVDARNCVAIACSCFGWIQSIGHPNCFVSRYTDHFDFYPRWTSADGDSLVYKGPALSLVSSSLAGFQGMTHPYLSVTSFDRLVHDEDLFPNLVRAWSRIHVTRRSFARDRRLFRALTVAYEACRVPQSMDSPLYDHGKHCSLWVSAFETLAHSGTWVGPKQVVELIGKRQLNHPRLSRKVRMRLGRERTLCSYNAAQRLYLRLYKARNAFLHGGRLPISTVVPQCLAEGIRLLDVTPLVFHTALEAFFGTTSPSGGGASGGSSDFIASILRYNALENGYLRAFSSDNG
jgi:hypothetical protein